MPIRYKIDILAALKESGYSSYKLRQLRMFGERNIQKIRSGEIVNADNLSKICELLQCQVGDILEYVPADTEPPLTDKDHWTWNSFTNRSIK